MTTLICSGTLFSGWRDTLEKLVPADTFELPVHTEVSVLAKEICQQQYSDENELGWKPFTPDNKYIKRASQLLSKVENKPLLIWADSNNCLYLNFCKTTDEDAKFVLFYSSPEFELSNFFGSHSFDAPHVQRITDAWVIRTQAMLTFLMNNRDRCLLVNVQSAMLMGDAFINALNEKFELVLEPNTSTQYQESTNSPLVEYLATTLLLQNPQVSELYDEVRSAATLLTESDKSISSIQKRNHALVGTFLNEVTAFRDLGEAYSELEEELSLNQLQNKKMKEELDNQLQKGAEKENIINTMVDYLSADPLLKFARKARKI